MQNFRVITHGKGDNIRADVVFGNSVEGGKVVLIKGATSETPERALEALLDVTMAALSQTKGNHIGSRAGHKWNAAGLGGMKGAGWYSE